jgi:DNA-binding response OmpR family regulator
MARVLVVDDEKSIVKGIRFSLLQDGYEVDCAYDGEEALEMAKKNEYDVVLLDLMLPKLDGIQVCKQIRDFSDMPIIMLTAKTEETSKVAGLDMGADDYVTKPFSILELLARVKAFLRRIDLQSQANPTKQLASVDAIDFADIHLDFKKFVATKGGVPLELSTREFQILKYFWQRRGEVVLREDLLQDLWGYTPDNMQSTRTIDNHIVNLRRKLEDDQANPKIILSIRGAGYKFDA